MARICEMMDPIVFTKGFRMWQGRASPDRHRRRSHMPAIRPLAAQSPWVELVVGRQDWDDADPDLLLTMLSQTLWIRSFEEHVLELVAEGLVHGPAHSSIGQEGGAVGSVLALGSSDFVNGSHRGHHQFLAKAFGHVA